MRYQSKFLSVVLSSKDRARTRQKSERENPRDQNERRDEEDGEMRKYLMS